MLTCGLHDDDGCCSVTASQARTQDLLGGGYFTSYSETLAKEIGNKRGGSSGSGRKMFENLDSLNTVLCLLEEDQKIINEVANSTYRVLFLSPKST